MRWHQALARKDRTSEQRVCPGFACGFMETWRWSAGLKMGGGIELGGMLLWAEFQQFHNGPAAIFDVRVGAPI
jgi:hypothetical protein